MGEREILSDPICQQKQSPNNYLSARRGGCVFEVYHAKIKKMTIVGTSSSNQVFSDIEPVHYCHVDPAYNINIFHINSIISSTGNRCNDSDCGRLL